MSAWELVEAVGYFAAAGLMCWVLWGTGEC